MAFFTRKGLTVPEFPSDCVLTEEPEEFNLPSTPSSLANSTPEESPAELLRSDVNTEFDIITKMQPSNGTAEPAAASLDINHSKTAIDSNELTSNKERERFDYVVDRTYGVEV